MSQKNIVMPSMGEGVNEATISQWLVKQGDSVEKDSPVVEVSTDKVDTEIVSPYSGFITEVLAAEGDTVRVDQVLARISSSATQPEMADPVTRPAQQTPLINEEHRSPVVPDHTAPKRVAQQVRSSPLVRKMAQDLNIDLTQVTGTGLHGRVTKADILSYPATEEKNGIAPIMPSHVSAAEKTPPSTQLETYSEGGVEYHEGVAVDRQPMSRMRQLIAKHMVESVRVSPHVTTVFEIDMHRVWNMREKHKNSFAKREGFKLTFTPFLIHAAVQAISQHPIVNSSLDGNDILYKKDINVGCAVALEGGLIVPVIKKAGELNLLGISRRLNELITHARNKKLKPDDVKGGTFSITNPGGFGSITSNPIINQPQVAILGIGAIVKRPVVINDMIAIRPQMLASLTFDHRVIDGEGGARWLASFKQILENYEEHEFS